jgi:hypothetical protein
MLEKIVRVARGSDYDFRMTACPSDPLAYRFDEWITYYRYKWAISRILKPKTILEIGVRFGYAAAAFLDASPSSRYIGVDLDVDDFGGVKGAIKWAKAITQQFEADFVIADSQRFDRLPGGIYDLVHVDGQQDGEGSFHDLELSIKQARYVLLDGYFWTPINFAAVSEFIYRYIFDGERSPLVPLLDPGSKRSYRAQIKAPGEHGLYTLRMTLVQEAVRWFDQAPTMLESDVSVVVKHKNRKVTEYREQRPVIDGRLPFVRNVGAGLRLIASGDEPIANTLSAAAVFEQQRPFGFVELTVNPSQSVSDAQ